MKIFILLFIIILIISFLYIYSYNIIVTTTDKMDEQIRIIEKKIVNDNYNIIEHFDYFESIWTKSKSKWALLIDHQEIDNIEQSINKIKRIIGLKDKVELLGEIGILKFYIDHIKRQNTLTYENIF